MLGWKAFRTLEGHTSRYDIGGNAVLKHAGSPCFPLNEPTTMTDNSCVWFCENEEDARAWARMLRYAYVAPVLADINVKQDGFSWSLIAKFVANRITRLGEMKPSGIDCEIALNTAINYTDIRSMAIHLVEVWNKREEGADKDSGSSKGKLVADLALQSVCISSESTEFASLKSLLNNHPVLSEIMHGFCTKGFFLQ